MTLRSAATWWWRLLPFLTFKTADLFKTEQLKEAPPLKTTVNLRCAEQLDKLTLRSEDDRRPSLHGLHSRSAHRLQESIMTSSLHHHHRGLSLRLPLSGVLTVTRSAPARTLESE